MVQGIFLKMKILVIMKRFGTNKDMVMQNFGRQVMLFEALSKLGHKIDFICPDYTKKESKTITINGIRYIVKPASFLSLISLCKSAGKLIKEERYDTIVATTDPLIGIMGYCLSKRHKIPLVYDLQDNFEVYSSYKLPFAGYLHKKAVKNADIVFAVSDSLKKYISRFRKKQVYVIQNGIDLKLFKKIRKKTARKKLKLPLKAKIIAYIGEISKAKGARIMLGAFEKVRKKFPDTHLLLSGKVQKSINIRKPNIIFRELPKREDVVDALNASDIALIPNLEDSFSRYCFPYKALEYMAVGLPIVSTSISDMKILLSNNKGSLCRPNDSEDMARCIISSLSNKRISYKNVLNRYSWENLAKKMENAIKENI